MFHDDIHPHMLRYSLSSAIDPSRIHPSAYIIDCYIITSSESLLYYIRGNQVFTHTHTQPILSRQVESLSPTTRTLLVCNHIRSTTKNAYIIISAHSCVNNTHTIVWRLKFRFQSALFYIIMRGCSSENDQSTADCVAIQ